MLGLAHSVVSTVLKMSVPLEVLLKQLITKQLDLVLNEMERLLSLWVEDINCRKDNFLFSAILDKALSRYDDVKGCIGGEVVKEHSLPVIVGMIAVRYG